MKNNYLILLGKKINTKKYSPDNDIHDKIGALIGIAFLTLWSVLTLFYTNVTIHGVDQVRDIAVARQFIYQGIFPIDSAAFTDIYKMPPGFYYILTVPLLLVDREETVFFTFGVLFILSLWWLWRTLLNIYGTLTSALFVALAVPFFSHLFVHSAWHNGLILTITNIYLVFLIKAISGHSKIPWAACVLILFLSVQISLTIAPHCLSFLLIAGRHRRKSINKWSIGAIIFSLFIFTVWIALTEHPFAAHSPQETTEHIFTRLHTAWAGISDVSKWWDMFFFPAYIANEIMAAPYAAIQWLALTLTLAGLGWSLLVRFTGAMDEPVRALSDSLLIWFLIALIALPIGVFYYYYAITSFVAVLAALGLKSILSRIASGRRVFKYAMASSLFAANFIPQQIFYPVLENHGLVLVKTGVLSFPRLEGEKSQIPLVPATSQLSLFRFLKERHICQDQITGTAFFMLNDLSLRGLSDACDGSGKSDSYYLSHKLFQGASHYFDSQAPIWENSGFRLFPLQRKAVVNSDPPRTTALSNIKENYGYYHPMVWADSVTISLLESGRARIRISLRCTSKSAQFDNPVWLERQLRVTGANIVSKPVAHRYDILWHDYFELEVEIYVATSKQATLSFSGESIACDVGVALDK